ncbi:MAG: PAS domain S-box protein [Deltaproteobacteria bacterium]|nr:PAS domain S-box protein [Deltaproteobacteria bacterium]
MATKEGDTPPGVGPSDFVSSAPSEGAEDIRLRKQNPFLSVAGSARVEPTSSTIVRELPLRRGRVSLPDYKKLVGQSTSRIALFEFSGDISVNFRADEILNRIFSHNSVCLEANLTFASSIPEASAADCIGKSFATFFPPHQTNLELFRKWIEGNFFLSNFEHRTISADGHDVVLQVSIYTIFEDAFIRRFWYVARDITALKRAVASLQTAEQHYRTLVERPGLVLVRAKPDGTYLYLSPHVQDIIGYTPQDFERTPGLFQRLLHPEDVAQHSKIYETRASRSNKTVEVEYRVRKKDGNYHWFFERQTAKIGEDGEVEYYDSIAFDIQERKLLEAELVHAQRMETIGSLAGGIAHDFNNHLTALLGQINLCLLELGSQHSCYPKLAAAEQAALCCAEMTKHLLSLGRKSDSDLAPLHPGQLIEDSTRLLSHLLPPNIEVTLSCDPDLHAVNANQAQLQQVLMNLVINGRDAMPEGGCIHITARNRTLEEGRQSADYPKAEAGRYVEITVTDCGEGIPPSHLPYIFEPFFTTKPVGEGTGLGLSMVYSIISSHHGAIRVSSERGIGTAFSFLVPALTTVPERLKRSEPTPLPRGKECILVADDDELVLSMVTTALCMSGYSVIKACDGQEALDMFRKNQSQIDLAIIDQTMPKRTGREVIDEIRSMDTDMRIIFTSGFGPREADFISPSNRLVAFMGKPYSLPDLLQKIRDLLEPSE